MRKTASIAVVLLCIAFSSVNTDKAMAYTPETPVVGHTANIFDKLFGFVMGAEEPIAEEKADTESDTTGPAPAENPEPKEEQKPKPILYKVKRGDTLTAIAKKHKTTWERIYAKNKQVEHPDAIEPGQKLTIPHEDEKLKPRKVDEAPAATQTTTSTSTQVEAQPAVQQSMRRTTTAPRGASAGNTYYYGYCTWYAKNMRPDLPNNLGNANTWVARAAAQGIPTGSTPRVGAIGQQGMHVVYIEKVHSNGTVTISEMNYEGFAVISKRTVPASTFSYIY